MRRVLTSLALLILIHTGLYSQQFSISAPSITSCSGVLEDTGGPAGWYANNENFTTVVCPPTVGSKISLLFVVFDLSPDGPFPDRIRIWDGPNTLSPSLGEYTNNELLNLSVSASASNTSGCLTVQFLSNSTGTGNFAAAISCSSTCDQPTASILVNGGTTAELCSSGTVQLDAGASYAAPGHSIDHFIWLIAGEEIMTTEPTLDHTILASGTFMATVQVVDDSSCASIPSAPVMIISSYPAQLDLTDIPTTVCMGDIIQFNANASIPPVLGINNCRNYGNGIHIPDDVGVQFGSDLTISSASPGAVITSAADVTSICVDMEHSFMGDIVIQLTCPNGQSVIMHQQGGGGSYVGGANDTDGYLTAEPGSCWSYCWAPDALNGTWAESVTSGLLTPGGTPENNALMPGTYSTVQPFSNLIGCPVNGTWTFSVTDLWGADNGFMCNWCLGLSAILDTSQINVGPILGNGLDSASWSGPDIENDPLGNGAATVQFQDTGVFNYAYSISDSFGCLHTDSIAIEVVSPSIDAGPDVVLCTDPVALVASPTGYTPHCDHILELHDSFGDGWSGGAYILVVIDGDTTSYSAAGSGESVILDAAFGQQIELIYSAGTIWNNENSFQLIDPEGAVLFQSDQGPESGSAFSGIIDCDWNVIQWTPTSGLSDPSSLTPDVFTLTSQWYHVQWVIADGSCSASDSVWVEAPPTVFAQLYYDEPTLSLCVSTGEVGNYDWYYNGAFHSSTTDSCVLGIAFGQWQVIVWPDSGCTIAVADTLICPSLHIQYLDETVWAIPGFDEYFWTYEDSILAEENGPAIPFLGDGLYIVQAYSPCLSADSILIDHTSIDTDVNSTAFTIMPNPSNGTFEILTGSPEGELMILDITGKSIHRLGWGAQGTRQMFDPPLTAGIYVIQLRTSNVIQSQRIIIH
jgi:subtilisin-like proprotein convertase family protein